jgi:hypothetical protein
VPLEPEQAASVAAIAQGAAKIAQRAAMRLKARFVFGTKMLIFVRIPRS